MWTVFAYLPDMLKRGGTKLSVIRDHGLYLICRCGHTRDVRVSSLIERLCDRTTVSDVAARSRCTRCQRRGANEYRITSPIVTLNSGSGSSREQVE